MALLSASCGSSAQKSPSGNIRAEVFADKEGLSYSVTHDGRTIIDTSAMGVTIGRHTKNQRNLFRHGTQSRVRESVQ